MSKDHLITTAAIAACVLGFIGFLTFAVWQVNTNATAFRMACIEKGGSYLGTEERICVMRDRP